MGKISTYVIDNTPQATDKVIGTDVNSDNQTKNYTLQSIADFDPVDTLQEVLNAGNTASASITLLGPSISTLLTISGVSAFQGDVWLTADFRDSSGAAGTVGQVLKSQGVGNGVIWGADSQPPLAATKLWYGDPTNVAVESTNILNDETGVGLLSLGQKVGGITILDNFFLGRVKHPVGGDNLSYGLNALANAQIGSENNTAVGISSLVLLTTGSRNVAVGQGVAATVNGDDNTGVGFGAIGGLATDRNTAIGSGALVNSGDEENVAVGYNSLNSATVGRGNTALGTRSGENILGGGNNITLGRDSGAAITTHSNIISIGQDSGGGFVGDDSIFIGTGTGSNQGIDNIAIGTAAGTIPGAFNSSIAIGKGAAMSFTETISIGIESGMAGSADRCIVIGARAGNSALAVPVPTDNIIIGTDACQHIGVAVGPNNIVIGTAAGHQAGGPYQDSIALGSGALTQRSQEFSISNTINKINLGLALAGGVATNAPPYVFPDNNTAVAGGLLVGDVYWVDPTTIEAVGGGPLAAIGAGGPAMMAIVY